MEHVCPPKPSVMPGQSKGFPLGFIRDLAGKEALRKPVPEALPSSRRKELGPRESLWGSPHQFLSTPSHCSGRRAQILSPTLPAALPQSHCLLQARFTHGMFTVYPGFGTIPPGGIQTINVDCVADPVGKCEEFIAIDISDRDPRDHPAGIPYSLLVEACIPGTEHSDGTAPPKRPSSVTPLPRHMSSKHGWAATFGT